MKIINSSWLTIKALFYLTRGRRSGFVLVDPSGKEQEKRFKCMISNQILFWHKNKIFNIKNNLKIWKKKNYLTWLFGVEIKKKQNKLMIMWNNNKL
jgi:hypothetical protein